MKGAGAPLPVGFPVCYGFDPGAGAVAFVGLVLGVMYVPLILGIHIASSFQSNSDT